MGSRPAGTCGRLRVDGQPCQNPPGCSINHGRVNRAATSAARLASPAPLSDRDFTLFPARLRDRVVRPLSATQMLGSPSVVDSDFLTAGQLMNEAISKSLIEGFTLSPRPSNTPGTVAGAPLNGYHCVALPGSDMLLPKDISLLADGRPEQRTLNALDSWLNYMRPVFASGQAWVGGYLRGSGPNAGRFEINVMLLCLSTRELGEVLLVAFGEVAVVVEAPFEC